MKRVKKIIHYCDNEIAEKGWLGRDVVVVVMDTGVALHPEIRERIWMFRDFVNEQKEVYDDNGHGTHVAGIIGGRKLGIAPLCKLIVLKVLDAEGNGKTEYCMNAFRWILENQEKYNIQVLNISMGMEEEAKDWNKMRILKAVELLWIRGITVVAAAGNLGPKEDSITIPGKSDYIITVGAYDVEYSGRGSWEKQIFKPDLVAPGSKIISCNRENAYVSKSGTSMAAPVVSGAAAVLLSKFPYISNVEIKKRLKESCVDLNMDTTWQGKGLLNMKNLLTS